MVNMKLRAELPKSAIVGLVDTREQRPLYLPGICTEPASLATGDYSLRGAEAAVAIERKSLEDLVACCGRERERFEREVQRLLAYPVRAVVIEANWEDIELANWRGRLNAKQVGASLVSWQVRGLPIIMAGHPERAGRLVSAMLRRVAIHRWRELRTFAAGLDDER